jgi:hypothetical protein
MAWPDLIIKERQRFREREREREEKCKWSPFLVTAALAAE